MDAFLTILQAIGPIAGLLCILAVVGATAGHFVGRQISAEREIVRTLRVALEHDPSPTQLSQALRRWPDAARYPGQHQRHELVKQANLDEGRRANRNELIKGIVRVTIGFAVFCLAIYIASRIFHPA